MAGAETAASAWAALGLRCIVALGGRVAAALAPFFDGSAVPEVRVAA